MGPQGTDPEVHYVAYDVTDGYRPIATFKPGAIPVFTSLVDEWNETQPIGRDFVIKSSAKIYFRARPFLPKTRRRFVKLMMSHGMQRNAANRIANVVGELHGRFSYGEITWNLLVAPWLRMERQVLFGNGQQPVGMVPDVDTEGEGGEQ